MISLLLRLRSCELGTLEFLAGSPAETSVGREVGELTGAQLGHARVLAQRGLAKLEAGWDGGHWYSLTTTGHGIVALLKGGAYPSFRPSLPAQADDCASEVPAPTMIVGGAGDAQKVGSISRSRSAI